MIAANKNLLKANLTQGVLGIQTNLIDLYTNNLSTLATQAALIAGFAFTSVIAQHPVDGIVNETLGYFYYVCFTICLVTALIVLSHATLIVNFGPTMALKGNSQDSVKVAAVHMRTQLYVIYFYCLICLTSLFVGSCVISWSFYPVGIATITTAIYLAGYYLLIRNGIYAYNIFVASDSEIFLDTATESADKGIIYKLLPKAATKEEVVSTNDVATNGISSEALEGIKLKARGMLWRRQAIEDGGLFVKCYAVLEKGRLDFYKSVQVSFIYLCFLMNFII